MNHKKRMNNTVFSRALLLGVLLIGLGCNLVHYEKTPAKVLDEETLYRPHFHFTPKNNWMNDPNGMFYFNGKYHLYFQHYPDQNVWGPMHWGHAVSEDMVHWEEKPIALYPDSLGYIFSGSAVVDHNNTSGFGQEGATPIVAMFTHHDMEKEKAQRVDVETQSIAYSLDEGLTWTKYKANPVIDNPNIRDFRDPKVFWHETTQKWVMVLAAHDRVMIYGSTNLKEWEFLSEFGQNVGNHDGVWECPDLFQLPVEGQEEQKYVLLVSNSRNKPNSGSATQYFVGEFDGTSFEMDASFAQELNQKQNFWMDFGKDNYAGVSWQNIQSPQGQKYLMGWMSNWEYATKVPTEGWRSAMTIARELHLKSIDSSYRLVSNPVSSFESYRNENIQITNVSVGPKKVLSEKILPAEIFVSYQTPEQGKVIFSVNAPNGDRVQFGFDADTGQYFVDRSASGQTDFSPTFANAVSTAPRFLNNDTIQGRIFLDKTSIEIFWDGGLTAMSEIFFTKEPLEQLTMEFTQGELKLHQFNMYNLNSN